MWSCTSPRRFDLSSSSIHWNMLVIKSGIYHFYGNYKILINLQLYQPFHFLYLQSLVLAAHFAHSSWLKQPENRFRNQLQENLVDALV